VTARSAHEVGAHEVGDDSKVLLGYSDKAMHHYVETKCAQSQALQNSVCTSV
jgi:cytidine deaminase